MPYTYIYQVVYLDADVLVRRCPAELFIPPGPPGPPGPVFAASSMPASRRLHGPARSPVTRMRAAAAAAAARSVPGCPPPPCSYASRRVIRVIRVIRSIRSIRVIWVRAVPASERSQGPLLHLPDGRWRNLRNCSVPAGLCRHPARAVL